MTPSVQWSVGPSGWYRPGGRPENADNRHPIAYPWWLIGECTPSGVALPPPEGKVSQAWPRHERVSRSAARAAKRQARAAAKRERRIERGSAEEDAPEIDEEALMARYGELSQQREANEIDEATFEQERIAIFVELGLVPAGES